MSGANDPSRSGPNGPLVGESEEHLRALAAAAADRVDEAIAICREAVEQRGAEPWPLEMLGYLLQRRGDTRGALDALERATEKRQPKAEPLYALARLYYRTGQFAKAVQSFERALALDPAQADSHYLKGLAEFHAGRTREAIGSLSRAAELDPANTIARYYLAVAHSRAGNLRSAIACLEKVVAAGGEDAAAHYHLGLAHYALGSMSEAARHFARSIEIEPYDEQSRRMFVMLGERARATEPGRRGRRGLLRSSIVWKVTTLAVAVFVTAGAALGLWLVRAAEAEDLALAHAKAEAVSDTVRSTLRLASGPEAARRLQEVAETLVRERAVRSLRVMTKEGRVLASTTALEVGTSVPATDPACVACHFSGTQRKSWTQVREVSLAGSPGLELLRPLFAEGGASPAAERGSPIGMVQLVTPLDDIYARRHLRRVRALEVGAASCGTLVLVLAAILWLLVRRPLAALQAAAGRVAAGELDVEVPGERLDEVGELVSAFNRMTRELREGRHELDEIHHDMERRIEAGTEQHRVASEGLRAANAKLVEFDRMKSSYIQKVVHDLRAPLSSVLMSLENINDGLVGPLSERQREVLGAAQLRAEAMTQLVQDLLDLERLRAGEARPTRVPVAPSAVFARAIDAVAARAQQRQVTVEAAGLAALPAIVGDPAALASVAENLLDNAVKYTQPGGLVRVEARSDHREIVIAVRDSGIGIPAAEIPLLFEEFFRASNARALEREGTGLGLAIVKRIVEAHGGTVSVDSVEGSGTTVTLRLPVAAAA
ncbi:MAG: tetratricopeptide repeat protein [Deltaproteobacteria bacterium]|nr:tetratricopeptide repeat protein [Deltaproteobacteria bacterium]